MAKTGAAAARERARAAKARLDAERVGREKKVEDAVTEFYLAADAFEAAETAAATARAGMATTVETLSSELKEPINGVAVLCGNTDAEVRALRKAAKDAAAPPPTGGAQVESTDQARPRKRRARHPRRQRPVPRSPDHRREAADKPVLLTFDDSQGSQMTEGLPQLLARDMTATFFAMTVVLDKRDWLRFNFAGWRGL